jgi:hypothetical protein
MDLTRCPSQAAITTQSEVEDRFATGCRNNGWQRTNSNGNGNGNGNVKGKGMVSISQDRTQASPG